MNGQLLSSVSLFPRIEPKIPSVEEAAWAQEPVRILWTREKYRPMPGIELLFSGLPTRCVVTICTELPVRSVLSVWPKTNRDRRRINLTVKCMSLGLIRALLQRQFTAVRMSQLQRNVQTLLRFPQLLYWNVTRSVVTAITKYVNVWLATLEK